MARPSLRFRFVLSLLAALLLGAVFAWALWPLEQGRRALNAIVDDSAEVRAQGWSHLLSRRSQQDPPRAARHLSAIHRRLSTGSDESLLDAADSLRISELWSWDQTPYTLMKREMLLRSDGDAEDRRLAVRLLRSAPHDISGDFVLRVTDRLLETGDSEVQRQGYEAAVAWVGRSRVNLLDDISIPDDAAHLRRLHRLVLSWANPPIPPDIPPKESIHELPLDEVEGLLVQLLRSEDDPYESIRRIQQDWEGAPTPPFAHLYREIDGTDAERALIQLAERGDPSARYALDARHPEHERDRTITILEDPREPPWRQRLAAWRVTPLDHEQIHNVLDLPFHEMDGGMYLAALLAERELDPTEARARAESWLRSLDPADQIAGLVLAVLIDAHADLIQRVSDASQDPEVRRLASFANMLIDDTQRDAAFELGAQLLRQNHEDFDPHIAAMLLRHDHAQTLRVLTTRPRGNWRTAVERRAILIERFQPEWHESIGRPIGGDHRGIELHLDRLYARWLLESR
ncbi:MAG: hypothetical protein EA377_10730 [Phycisphaerales bacterium]|nr:MAG: hypothetical protein EA377_10730 [Phycisphaerales bacterium]